MFYSPKEVECQLMMYPYSQRKIEQLEYLNYGNLLTANQREEWDFYAYTVRLVDMWFMSLSPDERDLIKYRCFENLRFDQISVFAPVFQS